MDMRSNQMELQLERLCGMCNAQVSVEGDVTLPGSLRETTNVLHASAMAVVESAEAMQDRISARGRVIFCVLYTQGSSGKVESIEATADFTHLCELQGAVPQAEVLAMAHAERVSATVLGGRMTMKATVRLSAKALSSEAAHVVISLDGPHVAQRSVPVKLRRTVARGNEDMLLREEFSLPADLSIRDTLCAWATASFQDAAGGQGRIGLSGEVTIEALHASDMPGKPLVMTRHTVPVNHSVELRGDAGDLLDGRINVKDVAVASQETGEGEHILRAEVLLGLSGWADREENWEVLTDAYTTDGDALRLESVNQHLRTGGYRIHAAESGKAALMLPEGTKSIRTMLAAFAAPVMTGHTQQGNRLVTEGTLSVTLVYMTDEGDAPVSAHMDVPFRAAFAARANPEDMVLLTAANVEAVPVTPDRAELRYVLHAQVEGEETAAARLVTDVTTVPPAPVTEDIVLYFTQPGEGTWEIARRYRVTEEELHRLNPDLQEEPQSGHGVVVWRRMAAKNR